MSTALVTGANRGLGLGVVRQLLLRPNYSLILAATRYKPVDDELAGLERSSEGRVQRVQLADVADADSCARAIDSVESRLLGGVNLIINNAGYAHQPKRLPGVRETGLSISTVEGALDYAKTWRTNCLGPLMLSCTLLDRGILRAAPNSVAPVVVNITSGQASVGNATELFHGDGDPRDVLYFHPIYAASKAALNAMTLHLARNLRDKVIVGAVHPGYLKTTMGRLGADLTVDESAAAVLDVVEGWKSLEDSGKYVNWKGENMRW